MHPRQILITACLASSSRAFVPSPSSRLLAKTKIQNLPTTLHIFNSDDDSTIPPELRSEIYEAESRTSAARTRPQRILSYGTLTFIGVSIAFFNAFLTSLRYGEGSPSSDLSYYGFGWVESNFLTSFFFMNKLGGGLGLLSAGLFGTLVEVEIRSRKENAEKIWEEMQRRKASKETTTKKKKKKRSTIPLTSKRSMTGRQKKRLTALEELMEEENEAVVAASSIIEEEAQHEIEHSETAATKDNTETKGIFSTVKSFYNKADSMAASQALLLNKELEDRGVIDKITDESGLKVIGKEAAAAEESNNKSANQE